MKQTKHFRLFCCFTLLGLFYVSLVARADVTSSVWSPYYFTCSCEAESKLYLQVDNNDDYDIAFEVKINIKECPGGFCFTTLTFQTGYGFRDSYHQIGGNKWGVNPLVNEWAGEWESLKQYCTAADIDYRIEDNLGSSGRPSVNLSDLVCSIGPTDNPNDCGALNP